MSDDDIFTDYIEKKIIYQDLDLLFNSTSDDKITEMFADFFLYIKERTYHFKKDDPGCPIHSKCNCECRLKARNEKIYKRADDIFFETIETGIKVQVIEMVQRLENPLIDIFLFSHHGNNYLKCQTKHHPHIKQDRYLNIRFIEFVEIPQIEEATFIFN